jgi:hypothetical protein
MALQMERKNSIASITLSGLIALMALTNTLDDSDPLLQTGKVRKVAKLLSGLSKASYPAARD